MAYFLGRDVKVYITTEDTVSGSFAGSSYNGVVGFSDVEGTAGALTFAYPRATATGSMTRVTDVTGVDLSIGAMDEDITYFGLRQVTKAEIKKETTVSLTRKKGDILWDAIFNNDGRYGCSGSSGLNGLSEPTINHGYRIHVVLLPSGTNVGDTFSVRGCCVQGHTASVNADGTTEETMEFMTYITPKVAQNLTTAALVASEL